MPAPSGDGCIQCRRVRFPLLAGFCLYILFVYFLLCFEKVMFLHCISVLQLWALDIHMILTVMSIIELWLFLKTYHMNLYYTSRWLFVMGIWEINFYIFSFVFIYYVVVFEYYKLCLRYCNHFLLETLPQKVTNEKSNHRDF